MHRISRLALSLGSCLSLISACDVGEPPSTCSLPMRLDTKGEDPATTVMERVLYRVDLDEGCRELTQDASGNVALRLNIVVPEKGTETLPSSLAELRAGERHHKFEERSGYLVPGNVTTNFDSASHPEWKLPWQDRPSTISLSVSVPRGTAPEKLPTSIVLELVR